MIKILHTIPALDGGGADRVIYDYCMNMLCEVHFDFIVHTDYRGILEDDLERKGCVIYHVPPANKGLLRYINNISKIIKNGNYDVVHVSQGFWGYFFIHIAKKYKVKVRIAHSHMANVPENRIQRIKRKIFTQLTILDATDLFACGVDAAKWMWGERRYNSGKVRIMTNGVNANNFSFSIEERTRIRKELGIENKLVIGNVARLTYQKNQELLLKIIYNLNQKFSNVVLLIAGDGELRNELIQISKELKIDNNVIFLGVRKDVNVLLNAMDVFVLPSRYEGFPITLIEAQMNGLPIITSQAVTRETKFVDAYLQIPLDAPIDEWCTSIISLAKQRTKGQLSDNIRKKRDINFLAKEQLQWYEQRVKANE